MTITFTICSNNYLSQAFVLGNSFLQHHPEAKFLICLVDKLEKSLPTNLFNSFEIIPVEKLEIHDFSQLVTKYNIVELNTAVKPSFIHYIFQNYNPEKLIYLDPDILVTSRFKEVLELLNDYNILITPHILSPIDDEFAPTDYHTLRGGVFNLGFIALSNYDKIKFFIDWWHDRVIKYGYADFARSMFYDQLWINYVPALFDNYYIIKHPGYNMANWNLHERRLTLNENDEFIVNGTFNLRFFHFSSYKYDRPTVICSYLTRYDFTNRPDLKLIFEIYRDLLKKNQIETIMNLPVFYYPNLNKIQTTSDTNPKRKFLKRIKSRVWRSFKVLTTGNE